MLDMCMLELQCFAPPQGAQVVQYHPPKYEYVPQDFWTLTILTIIFCGFFSPLSLMFSVPALLFARKVKKTVFSLVNLAYIPYVCWTDPGYSSSCGETYRELKMAVVYNGNPKEDKPLYKSTIACPPYITTTGQPLYNVPNVSLLRGSTVYGRCASDWPMLNAQDLEGKKDLEGLFAFKIKNWACAVDSFF